MDALEGLAKLARRAREEPTPVFGVSEAVRLRILSERSRVGHADPAGPVRRPVRPGGLGDPGPGRPVLELHDQSRDGAGGASAGDTVMVGEPKPEHPLHPHRPPLSRRQLLMQVVVAGVILASGVGIGTGGTILALKNRLVTRLRLLPPDLPDRNRTSLWSTGKATTVCPTSRCNRREKRSSSSLRTPGNCGRSLWWRSRPNRRSLPRPSRRSSTPSSTPNGNKTSREGLSIFNACVASMVVAVVAADRAAREAPADPGIPTIAAGMDAAPSAHGIWWPPGRPAAPWTDGPQQPASGRSATRPAAGTRNPPR